MRVMVFGATGYIGSHVAEQFVLAGAEVICPVRKGSNTDFLQTLALTLVEVDFTNPVQLEQLIQGADHICNCIADTRIHASVEQKKATEVELSITLLALAHRTNVKYFLQLSTVMSYGFNPSLQQYRVVNETNPQLPSFNYNQSAIVREQALKDYQSLHPSGTTQLVILQPANTLGKRDKDFLVPFLSAAKFGLFPATHQALRQFSCIDTRDIGRAMVFLSQLEFAKSSQSYLVKGYDLAWLDLKQALENKLTKSLKIFNLNPSLLKPIATLLEWLLPFGSHIPLTRFSLSVLEQHMKIDDQAIQTLGFKAQYQLQDSLDDSWPKQAK